MSFRTDTETGPGVFETALAYTTALRIADNALLFKYLVKSIGMKYGITPSFMAKPWGNVSIYFSMVDHSTDAFALVFSATWMQWVCENCVVLQPRLANSKICALKSYPRVHS